MKRNGHSRNRDWRQTTHHDDRLKDDIGDGETSAKQNAQSSDLGNKTNIANDADPPEPGRKRKVMFDYFPQLQPPQRLPESNYTVEDPANRQQPLGRGIIVTVSNQTEAKNPRNKESKADANYQGQSSSKIEEKSAESATKDVTHQLSSRRSLTQGGNTRPAKSSQGLIGTNIRNKSTPHSFHNAKLVDDSFDVESRKRRVLLEDTDDERSFVEKLKDQIKEFDKMEKKNKDLNHRKANRDRKGTKIKLADTILSDMREKMPTNCILVESTCGVIEEEEISDLFGMFGTIKTFVTFKNRTLVEFYNGGLAKKYRHLKDGERRFKLIKSTMVSESLPSSPISDVDENGVNDMGKMEHFRVACDKIQSISGLNLVGNSSRQQCQLVAYKSITHQQSSASNYCATPDVEPSGTSVVGSATINFVSTTITTVSCVSQITSKESTVVSSPPTSSRGGKHSYTEHLDRGSSDHNRSCDSSASALPVERPETRGHPWKKTEEISSRTRDPSRDDWNATHLKINQSGKYKLRFNNKRLFETPDQIRDVFNKFGPVSNLHLLDELPIHPHTNTEEKYSRVSYKKTEGPHCKQLREDTTNHPQRRLDTNNRSGKQMYHDLQSINSRLSFHPGDCRPTRRFLQHSRHAPYETAPRLESNYDYPRSRTENANTNTNYNRDVDVKEIEAQKKKLAESVVRRKERSESRVRENENRVDRLLKMAGGYAVAGEGGKAVQSPILRSEVIELCSPDISPIQSDEDDIEIICDTSQNIASTSTQNVSSPISNVNDTSQRRRVSGNDNENPWQSMTSHGSSLTEPQSEFTSEAADYSRGILTDHSSQSKLIKPTNESLSNPSDSIDDHTRPTSPSMIMDDFSPSSPGQETLITRFASPSHKTSQPCQKGVLNLLTPGRGSTCIEEDSSSNIPSCTNRPEATNNEFEAEDDDIVIINETLQSNLGHHHSEDESGNVRSRLTMLRGQEREQFLDELRRSTPSKPQINSQTSTSQSHPGLVCLSDSDDELGKYSPVHVPENRLPTPLHINQPNVLDQQAVSGDSSNILEPLQEQQVSSGMENKQNLEAAMDNQKQLLDRLNNPDRPSTYRLET